MYNFSEVNNMSEFKNETKIFKALTDENRLLILELLKKGEACSCNMVDKLPIKQSTISHHMKILIDSRIVNERKAGKYTYYSLSDDGIEEAINFMQQYLDVDKTLSQCDPEKGCSISK